VVHGAAIIITNNNREEAVTTLGIITYLLLTDSMLGHQLLPQKVLVKEEFDHDKLWCLASLVVHHQNYKMLPIMLLAICYYYALSLLYTRV